MAALERWPDGRAGQPGRVADGDREAPRDRRLRRSTLRRAQARASSAHELEPTARASPRPRRRARRRRRRRSAAADVHRVSSGAVDRGARRAHAAPARRARPPRRSRARSSCPSRRSRSASCARSARSPTRSVPFEVPRGAELRRAPGVGARGDLPHLQRGLLGDRGRRLDAAGAVRGRAAARPHPRRARARRARGARPRRADGDPGVARARARRPATASRSCCSIRTARAGISCSIRRGLAALARARGARRRRRGPYALQAAIAACHARARTAEETDWPRIAALYDALAAASRRRRSSSSIARSRSRWRSGPAAGLELVDALVDDEPALARYHLLPACAATCSRSSARRRGARGI